MGYDLPKRSSRGRRGVNISEDEADVDFWDQDFFKEDEQDQDYASESEDEDVADSDFSDSEEEEDEEGEEPAAEPRKRRILPPGTVQNKKANVKGVSEKNSIPIEQGANDKHQLEETGRGNGPISKRSDQGERQVAPILRNSTMKRRELAEQERQRQEELRTKRKRAEPVHKHKPLTQAEMLKEAAQTEIRNTESLQQLVAMEEETRKKALEKRVKYAGPLTRIKSCRVNDLEQTTMEWCNMPQPNWTQEVAIAPPRQTCVVTGLPARYKDPVTALPYANVEAFKVIRRRSSCR